MLPGFSSLAPFRRTHRRVAEDAESEHGRGMDDHVPSPRISDSGPSPRFLRLCGELSFFEVRRGVFGEGFALDLTGLGFGKRLLDRVDAAGLGALAAADQEADRD